MKINNRKNLTTMPEVDKTPAAPSPVPIPYPNTSDAAKVSGQSKKQAKQVIGGVIGEQKIMTQQMMSKLSRVASGELPKAAAFLKSPPSEFIQQLPRQVQHDLSTIGKSLDPANAEAIRDQFGSVVGKATKNGGAVDPNELVQHVLRESYMQTTEDLNSLTEKVKNLNQAKKQVRDKLNGLRENSVSNSEIKKWEEKLNSIGDDAQLANVDLQNILQKQQQTLQMMSNISKMLYDTATSVIRKMGG